METEQAGLLCLAGAYLEHLRRRICFQCLCRDPVEQHGLHRVHSRRPILSLDYYRLCSIPSVAFARGYNRSVVLGFYKNPGHGCAADYYHVQGSVCRPAISDSTADGHIPGYSDRWQ